MAEQEPKQIEVNSLNDYLEIMSKVVFQSGMSWQMIDKKWPEIRKAMDDFDVKKVADYDERDIERLSQDARVIRNTKKLMAIVGNARKMIELDKQDGGFKSYLGSQKDFDSTLKAMRKDFKFMGPMGVYYFLYVVGEKVPEHEVFQKQYRMK